MNITEQRLKLRSLLKGSACLVPASVYDPLSARVAETVGFEIGMLPGSVASNITLAAPDLIVLTLSEFADQIRRITRVSKLSLVADADHGYGNALNVMRTIQEFEHAGVSALSIEDTALPLRFGQSDAAELISVQEMVGKLKAAIAARQDPSLVIIGRTTAKTDDIESIIKRVQTYAATGIDMICLTGIRDLDRVASIHAAVGLPILVGPSMAFAKRQDLAKRGVRIRLPCHQSVSVAAAVKALDETYKHLFDDGDPGDLNARIASPQEMARLMNTERYNEYQRQYLCRGS